MYICHNCSKVHHDHLPACTQCKLQGSLRRSVDSPKKQVVQRKETCTNCGHRIQKEEPKCGHCRMPRRADRPTGILRSIRIDSLAIKRN